MAEIKNTVLRECRTCGKEYQITGSAQKFSYLKQEY